MGNSLNVFQELNEKHMAGFNEIALSHADLENIWDKFDKNKNGEMDRREIPKLLKELLSFGQEKAENELKHRQKDGSLTDDKKQVLEYLIERIKAVSSNGIDIGIATERLLKSLDHNKDQRISKDEFIKRFDCEDALSAAADAKVV